MPCVCLLDGSCSCKKTCLGSRAGVMCFMLFNLNVLKYLNVCFDVLYIRVHTLSDVLIYLFCYESGIILLIQFQRPVFGLRFDGIDTMLNILCTNMHSHSQKCAN